ncbi:O-antigen ligase family protein [Acinetobacter sp. ANC 3926]|uniref:O-antigen ligase-related domain-containing protein n=1 Tax=Acinetobacter genomosp. 15BJ TaxID=106651 RepID=R9BCP8_9GAMM|nr:O-antigen ligase family protein [Acinetobacter genomosp. 15BJ]EOR10171.1 hypothetical protein F896_00291 [Acinetobacter genomosp. 15BJ]MCH7290276.1 O-antigen ligase family protein [Acinetobacter genomosp. 15BJ]
MGNILQLKQMDEKIFTFFIGFAFLYGILSYQHYAPSYHDFYIHSIVFFLCSVGGLFAFHRGKVEIYFSNFLWILIFFVLLLQPILNNIIYIDGLIFPLAVVLLVFFLSVAASNIIDKERLIKNMGGILVVGAILLLLTQMLHVFKLLNIVDLMKLPLQKERFSGNLFQPNQAAFVFVLGVISSMSYIKSNVIKYIIIFFLSVGVAFTVSRSGFLMLIFCVGMFNGMQNYFTKNYLLKLKDLFFCLAGLFCGILAYPFFSQTTGLVERTTSALDDPRISLLYQSWLNISEHPITGVGWKNFTGTGLNHFEQIKWFSSADHSHFFISQLISEFGFLGLAVIAFFVYVFIKNIKISNIKEAYVFMILLVFLIYSCFEFPLWELKYLMIFSIFLSLFVSENKPFYWVKRGYLFSLALSVLGFLSLYYSFQYRELAKVFDLMANDNVTLEKKAEKIVELKPVFGFGFFNDIMVYEIIAEGNFSLKEKIELGAKVVNYFPTYPYLVRHATFLAMNKNTETAIYYFSASCQYEFRSNCGETKQYLRALSEQNPIEFKEIYEVINRKYKN